VPVVRAAPSSVAFPGHQPRRASRRLLLLYVCAIVGPTLAVLYLGIVSVQRQREAIATLTNATERLRLERLADALERRAIDLARASLTDARLAGVIASTDWSSPEAVHTARSRLDAVCRDHAICADLTVLRGDDTGMPLLGEPLPREPAALLVGLPISEARRRVDGLGEAERAERTGLPAQALRAYEMIAARHPEPRIRAVALAAAARLHARRGDLARAGTAWRRLAREHADAYDLAQRPHALVAALELVRLSPPRAIGGDEPSAIVQAVRTGLAAGRWQVSQGQAEYFARQLDALSPERVPSRSSTSLAPSWADSRLFSRFAVASQVRRQMMTSGAPLAGQVQSLSFPHGGRSHQVFSVTLENESNGNAVVSLDADLSWVRDRLFPAVLREVDPALSATPPIIANTSGSSPTFRRALSFWTLKPVAPIAEGPWWSNEVVALVGTIAGVLSVLALGVVLLLRDVARDAATARLRSDLVSGVSHELKTPLSVIRLYAESLASDFAARDDARAAHSRVILHESERLSHLVERVLAFSNQEVSPPSYQLELHDASILVANFIDRYTPYLTHLGFTVERDLETMTPDVQVDAAALTQALVNLVDNAVKYSGESRVLYLRVRSRGSAVIIEVEDHGIGIPTDERGRLFEAFSRGTRTAGRGGYGLGLYLVARIMQAHGGDIEVDVPAAGGTCMRLVLPAHADGTGA
jgi:signal transduction histidine kinase